MKRVRMLGGVVLAVAVAAVALPAQASDGEDDPGLPLESTRTEESCAFAAAAAGSDQCGVSATASPESGAVSASTHLVSPVGGTAAWKAQASARSAVLATYRLTEPVPELEFEITMHVNEARVALAPNRPGTDYGDQYYNLGRNVQIHASAAAQHSACSKCVGAWDHMVLSALRPGETVSMSGEDIVMRVSIDGEGGQPLPPGEVTIRAGFSTPVWQGNTWGDDSASIDAVVEKIILR